MSEQPTTAVEVLDAEQAPSPAALEAIGVNPSPSYQQAIELGHVYAASGLVPSARNAARAAVVIMIGLDMGLSPSASILGIHVIEDNDGKVNFVIEGRVLGTLINRTPGIAFKVEESTDEKAVLSFWRGEEEVGPKIEWDKARAVRAGLWGKGAWTKHPNEMLRWRALAEGTRIYFPEVIGGQRVYVEGEIEQPGSIKAALTGPEQAPQLGDDKAEELRAEARSIWEEINALNPERMVEGKLVSSLRAAGHSHVELELAVSRLRALLADEKAFWEAYEAIATGFGEDAAKEAKKVADRRGSVAEGTDHLRRVLAKLEEGDETPAEEGDPDADA